MEGRRQRERQNLAAIRLPHPRAIVNRKTKGIVVSCPAPWYDKAWGRKNGRTENGKKAARMKNSFEQIYEVVRKIPMGRVATYGQIAALAGNPRWSRVVGYALHVNPEPGVIPCHRVVNRFGEPSSAFAFGGVNRQILMLEEEGVEVVDGRVDLSRYLWDGRM